MSTNRRLRSVIEEQFGPATFGGFLRGARTAQDKTQTEMARFLNVSKSTLCDIEKGRQLVSPALAARIAHKCGLSEEVAVETTLMDQLRRAKLPMEVAVRPKKKRVA